jgi:hypothetical protein
MEIKGRNLKLIKEAIQFTIMYSENEKSDAELALLLIEIECEIAKENSKPTE